ncbi:MAG TPA: thiamine phosphate synthase [Myxococcales bacterium]|jgi:thiamine-phosphate pyrophosphorylase
MPLPHGIYAIVTDTSGLRAEGKAARPPLELVSAFVAGGAAVVQLRLKDIGASELLRIAREARKICAGRSLLIVNDRPDVARLAEADGVHLGQDDLPVAEARKLVGDRALIGLSTHSDAEIAGAQGADYIGFGPVFSTRSKPGAPLPPPHGIEGLARAVRLSGVPVVAIGGLTAANAAQVAAAGARCAAAIAELCAADDPAEAVRAMQSAWQAGAAGPPK